MDYLILLGVGLIGGFLAGLLGIGGGVIYVLALPYLLINMGFPQEEIVSYTIANSIVGNLFASLSVNVSNIRNNKFPYKEVLCVGSFAALSSILLTKFFVNEGEYSQTAFNLAIIGLMMLSIFSTLRQNLKTSQSSEKRMSGPTAATTGAASGAIAALSGLGGGVVIVPIMNSVFKMDMFKAKAVSMGVIFITALSLTIVNLIERPLIDYENQSIGYIVLPLAIIISLGVAVGSVFGVKVAQRLSNRAISLIFVVFLIIVMIDKAIQLLY